MDDADLEVLLSKLDGVVLAGCKLDLDPVRMGLDPSPMARPMPRRREDFDRRIAKMCIDNKMPILGVGSGMQLVNVLCGGSVYQHIPDELPRALYHDDPVEKNLRHVLEIVPQIQLFSSGRL